MARRSTKSSPSEPDRESRAGPDLAHIDSIDLPELWRTVPVTHISDEVIARLRGALIERARSASKLPPVDALVLRAQAREIDAWIYLGEFFDELSRLGPRRGDKRDLWRYSDLAASCLLVASDLGSRWSSALLVLGLTQLKDAERPDDQTLRRLLLAYGTRFTVSKVVPRDVVGELGVRDLLRAEISPPAEPAQPTAITTPRAPTGPAVTILHSKPEESKERDMQAVLDRYHPLASPVELVGLQNPDGLAKALTKEFPWASEIIEEFHAELCLSRRLGTTSFTLPPILLVGLPGVGKSTFIRRLSALSGVPAATLVVAGSSDARLLSGTARGWASATPSFPLTVIRRHQVANPIIAIEELDRAGGSERSGFISDRLGSMLDPSLARRYFDECLVAEADLSLINWVMTANRLDLISPAIRGRCRIFEFPAPRPQDFEVLLTGIIRDLAEQYHVEVLALPELSPASMEQLRAGFQRGLLQARQLSGLVRRAMSLQVASDSAAPLH